MRNARALFGALTGALALPSMVACRGAESAPETLAWHEERSAREGEYLVTYAGAPPGLTVEQELDDADIQVIRSFELLPGVYHVRSPYTLAELQQILGDRVEALRPNRLLFATSSEASPGMASPPLLPNDPLFSGQWNLRNRGQTFGEPGYLVSGTSGADVRATLGWPTATGTRMVVAVLDSGIDLVHPDLIGNLWVNRLEARGSARVDDDGNGYVDDVQGWNFVPRDKFSGSTSPGSPNVDDIWGHGTEVASILGAVGHNAQGMTGVAWNCRIMPLRIFEKISNGLVTDVATAIAALEYAVRNGAKISSNSWGAYTLQRKGDFADLYDAIDVAGRSGHLFVASAGNGSGNTGTDNDAIPFLPASFPLANIVSVTGVGYRDELPKNFNYGATSVDLAAPGVKIVTADVGNHTYKYVEAGTSYATPHVAAAAALLWGNRNSSTWSFRQVRERLLETARQVRSLSRKTVSGGVLDLEKLLGTERPPFGERPVEASQPK